MRALAPDHRRLAGGLAVAVMASLVLGSTFGFAQAAGEPERPTAVQLGQMRVGDEVIFHEVETVDIPQIPNHDGEPRTYRWSEPRQIKDGDGLSRQVNVLISSLGDVEQEFWVDPESATVIASTDHTRTWSQSSSELGGLPTGASDTKMDEVVHWFRFDTLPCGIMPQLPETLEIKRAAVHVPDCLGSDGSLSVSMDASLATLEGERVVLLEGSRDVSTADWADGQIGVEAVAPGAMEYSVRIWVAPGIPYPVQWEQKFFVDFAALGSTGVQDSTTPTTMTFTQEGRLLSFLPGDGEILRRASVVDGSAAPPLMYSPSSTLGPQAPAAPGLYTLAQAYQFALENTDGDMQTYLDEHPRAYVSRAEHRNLDDQGAIVQEWRFALHDGRAGFEAVVHRSQAAYGHDVTRHLPADAPMQQETQSVESWGDVEAYIEAPMPDQIPAELPTIDSLYARWLTYDQQPTGGSISYGFMLGCDFECENTRWEVWAGQTTSESERTYEIINDGNVSSEGVGRFLKVDDTGSIGIAQRTWSQQDAVSGAGANGGPGTAVARLPGAKMSTIDPWWSEPAPAAVAGAGFLGIVLGLLYVYAPKLLGVGLFSRIRDDQVLQHPLRRSIHLLVEANPGIHMQEVARRIGKSTGVARHHLDKLRAANLLVAKQGPQHLCYFIQGSADSPVMAAAAHLKSDGARRVLEAIMANPGAKGRDIAAAVDLSPGTVSHHMKNLEAAGLLELARQGRTILAKPTELGRRAAAAS